MRIINIVDNIQPINSGIWKAATSTAGILKETFQVVSEIWFPDDKTVFDSDDQKDIQPVGLSGLSSSSIKSIIKQRGLEPAHTVIITHGAWRYPTRWGAQLKKLGFVWIYVPQGMLEPWSVRQKRFKKWLYFHLIEQRYVQRADAVRAVSQPEWNRLSQFFKRVEFIPNGVAVTQDFIRPKKLTKPTTVLFMARLHHKKGVIPLVKAWVNSYLYNNPEFQLLVAGPDDGELSNLTHFLSSCGPESNICYLGAVYGDKKKELLENSDFYILPSHSEGFPTSVLEAMQYGLVPLVSEGCNFPELFNRQIALKLSPAEEDIRQTLNQLVELGPEQIVTLSNENREFVSQNYSLNRIANEQMNLYLRLLKR